MSTEDESTLEKSLESLPDEEFLSPQHIADEEGLHNPPEELDTANNKISLLGLIDDQGAEVGDISFTIQPNLHFAIFADVAIINEIEEGADLYLKSRLGAQYFSDDRWSLKLHFDKWGLEEALSVNGIGFSIGYGGEKLSVDLSGARRKLTVVTINQNREIDQSDLGLSMTAYFFAPIYFGTSYDRKNYSIDMTRFNSVAAERLVSTTAIAIANQFYNWEASFFLGSDFDRYSIELNFGLSEAAVDSAKENVYAIANAYQINRNWSVLGEISYSVVDIGDETEETQSLQLGITYLW